MELDYSDLEFDEEKYFLGTLCRREHKWLDTEVSLRRITDNGCLKCAAFTRKRYMENNKEKMLKYHREYRRKWLKENRECARKKAREYARKNKEKKSEHHKKWYYKNQEAISKRGKKYYRENKEAIKLKSKKYNAANREKRRAYNSIWGILNSKHKKKYQREYNIKNRKQLQKQKKIYRNNHKREFEERILINQWKEVIDSIERTSVEGVYYYTNPEDEKIVSIIAYWIESTMILKEMKEVIIEKEKYHVEEKCTSSYS